MTLRLFEGDCLSVMKDLSANSIDCFVCDLPYGCLTGGGGQEKKRRRFQGGKDTGTEIKQTEGVIAGCSWDVKIDLEEFWKQVKRLAKDEHTPVLMFCTLRFGIELVQSNPKWFRYDLVWDKARGVSFLSANKMPLRSHEMIFVFSKAGAHYERIDIEGDFPAGSGGTVKKSNVYGKSPIYGEANGFNAKTGARTKTPAGKRCVKSIITIPGPKGLSGRHPTEKPVDLYKWLIERYCPKGGTVLDPTAGSFNSCFAAQALGRNAVGIEKDPKFFKKAKDRVDGSTTAAESDTDPSGVADN